MKKLLILTVFLISCFALQAQMEWDKLGWSVSDTVTTDSIYWGPSSINNDWTGYFVTFNITIWHVYPKATRDGTFRIGGWDPGLYSKTGKKDFNYYGNDNYHSDIDPITADTAYATTTFTKNADSTRYNFRATFSEFAFPLPALEWVQNNADSIKMVVDVTAVKR